MSRTLERAVRLFVAIGADLDRHFVIAGNSPGQRPNVPYASVLLIEDKRKGYPVFRQLEAGRTSNLFYRQAKFSLQFYRPGAVDLAERFDNWCQTENGLTYAETAFSNGYISYVKLISGGSGYTSQPAVRFQSGGGTGALAEAGVVRGAVSSILLLNRGEGYSDAPRVEITGGGGSGATATTLGFGFRILFPLTIRRLDEIVGDKFEERTQLDLTIDYATWMEQNTGEIDELECAVYLPLTEDTTEVESGVISLG